MAAAEAAVKVRHVVKVSTVKVELQMPCRLMQSDLSPTYMYVPTCVVNV